MTEKQADWIKYRTRFYNNNKTRRKKKKKKKKKMTRYFGARENIRFEMFDTARSAAK